MRLWVAQGFGVGRISVAPGTFGSFVGLGWYSLLLIPGHFWCLVLGIVLGIGMSVWLCGFGEELLGKKDPSSVVLDEVAAVPVCFISWIGLRLWKTGAMPSLDYFFSKAHWLPVLGVVLAFRLFDIWKPWPVRQSQSLPGGWGITIDDLLAAVYVNLVVLAIGLWRAS